MGSRGCIRKIVCIKNWDMTYNKANRRAVSLSAASDNNGMKHPEIALLPILMFSDYFLTVLGTIQKDKKYSNHFKGVSGDPKL